MKRFVIWQSEDELYITHAGLAFIGPALNTVSPAMIIERGVPGLSGFTQILQPVS